MKSVIFQKAIKNRNKIRMLYKLNEIVVEPYYVTMNRNGKKVVYGRICNSNKVEMLEFDKILNIKMLEKLKFYPLIPIISQYN
ncbi:MAG: hypothetical protein GXX85_02260 [Ignavibacteria bacterium]|nr:hypothetical protein [Ignavibacteria bacterium]